MQKLWISQPACDRKSRIVVALESEKRKDRTYIRQTGRN
jgi:hypothetical protein